MSFETSFNWKQPKLEPKLVSALSETKRLFRLFRFYSEAASFVVSVKPKLTETNRNQPKQAENSAFCFSILSLKLSVLHHLVLSLDVSVYCLWIYSTCSKQPLLLFCVSIAACAASGHVCFKTACAATGHVSLLWQPVLPLNLSLLQQSVLSLDVSVCLLYSAVVCTVPGGVWPAAACLCFKCTYLFNSSQCCVKRCIAYSSMCCICTVCLQEPVLHLDVSF